MIRIISFNINGLRARPHQLEELKRKYDELLKNAHRKYGTMCKESALGDP